MIDVCLRFKKSHELSWLRRGLNILHRGPALLFAVARGWRLVVAHVLSPSHIFACFCARCVREKRSSEGGPACLHPQLLRLHASDSFQVVHERVGNYGTCTKPLLLQAVGRQVVQVEGKSMQELHKHVGLCHGNCLPHLSRLVCMVRSLTQRFSQQEELHACQVLSQPRDTALLSVASTECGASFVNAACSIFQGFMHLAAQQI